MPQKATRCMFSLKLLSIKTFQNYICNMIVRPPFSPEHKTKLHSKTHLILACLINRSKPRAACPTPR